MDSKLEHELVTTFRALFDRTLTHPTAGTEYYGCACGDGWFGLLKSLCALIVHREKQADYNSAPVKILQIKEKFGALRFYFEGGDDYINGAVNLAETVSTQTCEITGRPGALYRRSSGWLQTLCAEEARKINAELYVVPG